MPHGWWLRDKRLRGYYIKKMRGPSNQSSSSVDVSPSGAGLADAARLGDGRVLEEGALDLERADEVAGGVDDVVGTADKPEVAVGVAAGAVAGDVPAVAEARLVQPAVVPVGTENGGPAGTAGHVPLL